MGMCNAKRKDSPAGADLCYALKQFIDEQAARTGWKRRNVAAIVRDFAEDLRKVSRD